MKNYLQSILKHAFVLNIYTYSSLMSSGGLGKSLIEDFEKSSQIKTHITTFGDSFQMVNQLELDAKLKRKLPDIVLGFDQNTWPRVKPFADQWSKKKPNNISRIKADLLIEPGFLPFDYGELGFIANIPLLKKLNLEPPKKLEDLLQSNWKRKFILEDPRLSTPGLFFLIWSKENLKNSEAFWKKLRIQWLTLTPGWSEAYSLFLKDQAPLVWSYRTSLAYHRSEKKGDLYDFLKLEEGAPIQIEGAAVIDNKNEAEKKAGFQFLDFLISESIQKKIAKTQWMLPVRKDIDLPEEFKDLQPQKKITIQSLTSTELESILSSWKIAISR